MRKFNFSKLMIITVLLILAAVTAILFSANRFQKSQTPGSMTRVINDSTGFFDQMLSAPKQFLADKVNAVDDLMNTYDENQVLKATLTQSQTDTATIDSLKSENKALKDALGLKETLTNYDKIAANVITRNPATWNDQLIIDKGKVDGLADDMLVVANGGVIGRVVQTNDKTAKVALLSTEKQFENKIPVRLGSANQPSYGYISSYDKEKDAYIVSAVTTKDEFAKDSQVLTSGLGGNSPRDLLLGTVIGEKKNEKGLDREIYVKPAVTFSDIRFVYVISRLVTSD